MSTIIKGKYAYATVYRDEIEQYAEAQIKMICDMNIYEKANIQIMPDVHPGKVGPIGLVMEIPYDENTCIMPTLVGNDIGCGISWTKIMPNKREKNIDFKRLTKIIDSTISDMKNVKAVNRELKNFLYRDDDQIIDFLEDSSLLYDYNYFIMNSLGTLGGGNHFIEIGKYEDDLYMIVHSGSRSFGNRIYEKYMRVSKESSSKETPYELSYLYKDSLNSYMHDSHVAECCGVFNRSIIIRRICLKMGWDCDDIIKYNVHNMIYDNNYSIILTKGANCLRGNADVCIPINSADGCIIGKTKNISGKIYLPHGFGRIIKRSEVANNYTVNGYRKLMDSANVYCNNYKDTLDECPLAYRRYGDIAIYKYLNETIDMENAICTKPIYNYRSKGE